MQDGLRPHPVCLITSLEATRELQVVMVAAVPLCPFWPRCSLPRPGCRHRPLLRALEDESGQGLLSDCHFLLRWSR